MDLQRKMLEWTGAQAGRFVLWLPVFLAFGIAIYFLLPVEPNRWSMVPFIACGCTVLALFWRVMALRIAAMLVLLVAAGFLAAQIRTHAVYAPTLSETQEMVMIQGVIEEKSRTQKGFKLILQPISIDTLSKAQLPKWVQLSIRDLPQEVGVGDAVAMKATLYPPGKPAYPGGFDFQRYFYFKQIGGMGFALPNSVGRLDANVVPTDPPLIEALRFRITEAIRSAMSEPQGAVAAAFITGDTRGIPDALMDAMRASGIYHLLAVSGMNLVIVSGILFLMFRGLMALVPWIALRLHPNKWAAAFALLGSYFYLLIAGSPVSAERAFVMVCLVLGAVMLDRTVTPMRSLMLAATLILLIAPESLLNASFHLSFAATMGLVAWYEITHEELKKRADESGWHWRVRFYLEGVLLTSFIAWVCTMPFIMYHFQQLSSYSLPANMIAVPIVSVVVMPALVIALFLMPFGLHGLPLWVADICLRQIAHMAQWFASLPDAVLRVPPMQDWGILLAAAGLLWLCIWQGRIRWAGVLPILACVLAMRGFTPPQVLIAEGGKQVIFHWQDQWIQARGRSGMQVEQWQEWLGAAKLVPAKEAKTMCDRAGCFIPYPHHPVSIVFSGQIRDEECREASLVIFPLFNGTCANTPYLGRDAIDGKGAVAIWVSVSGYQVRYADESLSDRPWHRISSPERYKIPVAPEAEADLDLPSGAAHPPQ